MSVFLESTHLFPYYMCQAGVLAECILRHFYSGMGKEGCNTKKKKNVVDVGGLILVSLFVSISITKKPLASL